MKELIRFGTQFIGYRDYAAKLEGTFCFLVEHILSLFLLQFFYSPALHWQKNLRKPTNVLTLLLLS
jgi:hypothetical protein